MAAIFNAINPPPPTTTTTSIPVSMMELAHLVLPPPSRSISSLLKAFRGGQMTEWLGSRAINQKVVGSIPGRAK